MPESPAPAPPSPVGALVVLEFYGGKHLCRILKQHTISTFDVERITDGQCFRINDVVLIPRKES